MKVFGLQLIGKTARKFGRGSSIVGYIDSKFNLKALNKINLDDIPVVFVTGTNGKTSIVNLINEVYKKDGQKVLSNLEGANLISGIKTSLIMNSKNGKLDCDVLLLEVDEKTVKPLSKIIKPNHVILSNFFRDQLDRYFEISLIIEEIMEVIKESNAKVYYNSQDPLLYDYISQLPNNEIVSYKLNADNQVYKENDNIVEIKYCPACHSLLNYEYYHYAHIGEFACPKCDFKAQQPTYDLHFNEKQNILDFTSDKEMLYINLPKEKFPKYMLINFSLITTFLYGKVKNKTLENSLLEINMPKGRNNKYVNGEQSIYLNLAKNVAGMEQTIKFLIDNNDKVNVLIAFNDDYADGKDVSWIWDVNFLPLINKLDKLYIVGKRKEDMKLRFLYEDFENIETFETIEEGLNSAFESSEDFAIVTNYTPLATINNYLKSNLK